MLDSTCLSLTYFIQHNTEVYPCFCKWQNFIFLFLCISVTDFWFIVTGRFIYSNLYMWLSCWSLNFKYILTTLLLYSHPITMTVLTSYFVWLASLIEVQLIYNIVLVSDIQQNVSVIIYLCIYLFFLIFSLQIITRYWIFSPVLYIKFFGVFLNLFYVW